MAEHNYCGAEGYFSVPNIIYGANINECCKVHDQAYRIGGSKALRLKKDQEFLFDMLRAGCYRPVAYLYYYAVRCYGWIAWRTEED